MAWHQEIEFSDSGELFIAYYEGDDSMLNVIKFDNGAWTQVGPIDIARSFWIDLEIDGETPYVAFQDLNASGASVLKYDGTSWTNIGMAGFSPGSAFTESLDIADGELRVAFTDNQANNGASVMRFELQEEGLIVDCPADITLNCGDPLPAVLTELMANNLCSGGTMELFTCDERITDQFAADGLIIGSPGLVYFGSACAQPTFPPCSGVGIGVPSTFSLVVFTPPSGTWSNFSMCYTAAFNGPTIRAYDAANNLLNSVNGVANWPNNNDVLSISANWISRIEVSAKAGGANLSFDDITYTLESTGKTSVVTLEGDVPNGEVALAVSNVVTDAAPTPFCSTDDLVITRTYTVEDGCGNSGSCVQTITFNEDTSPPVLSCPDDNTITLGSGECGTFISFLTPTATDTCNGVTPLTLMSGPDLVSGDFFEIGSYTYEYESTDDCGNVGTCEFTFVVEEVPNVTNSLSCIQSGVQISLDENCEALIGAEDILSGGPYRCFDDYMVKLFFDANMFQPVLTSPYVTGANIGESLYVSIEDPFTGNSCWGIITVEDKQIPNLECSAVDVPCTSSLIPSEFSNINFPIPSSTTVVQIGATSYSLFGFDGCGEATLNYFDSTIDIDCLADPSNPYSKIIFRNWTATDAMGNSTDCQDTINLIRATFVDLILPPDFDDQDEPSLLCENRETVPPNNTCGNVVGWNVIDEGDFPDDLYVGHPSPLDELYPCGNVKWSGTGIPGGIDCGNINYSFEDI